ncbi:DUF143-domain-containing protein [Rozella allomycis CSF55]|uniref:DUF143-domain-containing protein n=1 Tax=Rozella allomycis (strain CSF55) TaxID=988480 RepID=A0A075AYV2_ROZAC|nr:Oligomerisation domain-containing protein [Rozella allomycis CSF55]RKP16441.1 DUF143-domain-containing protein [Rozella allomycis CSF55]|eukprot:EPZ35304.1 Oligomerisation domain-containing protein [Rozella allomycis CSF55]
MKRFLHQSLILNCPRNLGRLQPKILPRLKVRPNVQDLYETEVEEFTPLWQKVTHERKEKTFRDDSVDTSILKDRYSKDPIALDEILTCLEAERAINITVLDVKNRHTFCNYFVIAEGTSGKGIRTIATGLCYQFKHRPIPLNAPLSVEGKECEDWKIVDFGPVVVHLFTEEARSKYKLEKLWEEDRSQERVPGYPLGSGVKQRFAENEIDDDFEFYSSKNEMEGFDDDKEGVDELEQNELEEQDDELEKK